MLTARDIMTTDVFILDLDASVEEAAWAFSRQNIGGAPVRTPDGRIAGFLSRGDLVNPAWADWVRPDKATVGDIMTPNLLAVPADAPAMNVARGMVERGIHHVVVIDGDQRVMGMISSLDVVKALALGRPFEEHPTAGEAPPIHAPAEAGTPR
jgi:CBS domain-containing protein